MEEYSVDDQLSYSKLLPISQIIPVFKTTIQLRNFSIASLFPSFSRMGLGSGFDSEAIFYLLARQHGISSPEVKSTWTFRGKINNNVTLSTLSILEALYELSEIEHGREFLTLLQLLSSVISNKSMELILRIGPKAVSGRILSKENYILADELSVKTVLSVIDRILCSTGTQEIDECEPALEVKYSFVVRLYLL